MTDTPVRNSLSPRARRCDGDTTPTGLQSLGELGRRRWLVLVLNLSTYLALLTGAATLLGGFGWSLPGVLALACFAVAAPWTVLGWWNAVIGLWLMHGRAGGREAAAPFAAAGLASSPLTLKTAVVMTVRNEVPERAMTRLAAIKASLDQSGAGAAFTYFVLSDTSDPRVAEAEAAAIADWQARSDDPERIIYRRRTVNEGYKAGNIREFCHRWGDQFDLMLALDADSLMSAPSIIELVRIMQAHPRIGILQSLVVGMPSDSAFARMFQFGMRQNMRCYTMGQSWWVGDCGPFWGHNALVRIQPFMEHCELPTLAGAPPFGGRILSHDQVEAVLMRRSGYEVRVLAKELGSWEENPPHILEYMQRDERWCQGNLQYARLIAMPGLFAVSRYQLIWAISMFLGIPAWTGMIALSPWLALEAHGHADAPAVAAAAFYVAFLVMFLTPKLTSLIDVALTAGGMARYGGGARFLASAACELVFSFLQLSLSSFRTTMFMLGLLIGRSIGWGRQERDAHGVSWREASRQLWPQTLFGFLVCGALWQLSPATLLWSLPLTAGYVVAIPFCVLTAAPAAGRLFRRWGVCAIPEEIDTPAEILAVQTCATSPVAPVNGGPAHGKARA